MKNKLTTLLASAALFLTAACRCEAATTLTLNYNTVTEVGVASPVGVAPWLTATFTSVDSNTVTLKIDAKLSGSEFISKIGFNTVSGVSFSNLSFTATTSGGSFTTPSVISDFNGGQGTNFTFGLNFTQGPPSARFNGNDSITYTIDYSGPGTFNPEIFNVLDEKRGLVSIAHVQSIGTQSSSAWISPGAVIPEPSAALLGAVGFIALLRRRR